MKTPRRKRTAKARADSLHRRVSRIDLRKPANRRAIEALIALALRPELRDPPTDDEIERFMREYDEGKHPLSKEGKDRP